MDSAQVGVLLFIIIIMCLGGSGETTHCDCCKEKDGN